MTRIRSLPAAVLRFIGILIYHLGLARVVIGLRRGAPRIVAYHACEPTESAFVRGLDCNTPPALFASHVAFFAAHYHVVPLASIVSDSPERALAITFDDAYRSVYEHALPVLRRYRCPAAVFVVTDAIEHDTLIWVNELTWLLNMGGEAARREAARIVRGKADSPAALVVARAREYCAVDGCRDLLDRVSQAAGALPPRTGSRLHISWEEAAEMSAAGITFGNHTASHPDLSQLDAPAQQAEMRRADWVLAQRVHAGARVSALAYPFGAHNNDSIAAVASNGIRIALTIGGRTDFRNPIQLARTPVGRASVARVFADLEIVEPMKASLRRMFLPGSGSRRPRRSHDRHHRPATADRHVPDAPQV